MRINLIAVGRLKSEPEASLARHFQSRLNWGVSIREVEEKKILQPASLRKREGELLLAAIPKGSVIIALDEKGKNISSRAFANQLAHWRDNSRSEFTFLLGGVGGLDQTVLDRASLILSLGLMTWPHLLVRGLLFEQLYRAQQILAGHPYHRE